MSRRAAITGIEQTIREIGNISSTIAAAVTEQGAATQEIARGVEVAAERTVETANEVNRWQRRQPHSRPFRAAERLVCFESSRDHGAEFCPAPLGSRRSGYRDLIVRICCEPYLRGGRNSLTDSAASSRLARAFTSANTRS